MITAITMAFHSIFGSSLTAIAGFLALCTMTAKMREEARHYHALNVAVLSMMLAKEMGLAKKEIEEVGMGSLFHDIGKGRVPIQRFTKGNVAIMNKVLKEYYMEHPKIGAKMLAAVPGFPPSAQTLVLQHHEHLDGTGFPARLQGDAISFGARIAAVANLYDRFCNSKEGSERPTPHEAMLRPARRMSRPGRKGDLARTTADR